MAPVRIPTYLNEHRSWKCQLHLTRLILNFTEKHKNMKQLKFIILIMITVFMASCLKDDKQATGNGDAMIVAKKIGENTVYGISLYAYTFSSFQSVTAVSSANPGKTYTLKANQGFKTNFYYDTPDAEFTTTIPAAATYNFSAIFENGVSSNFQNVLSDKVLPLPTIDSCKYNSKTHLLEVNWTKLTDADSYAIYVMDGSTPVFGSSQLAKAINTYSISAAGGGWANGFTPQSGKTYTVRLLAFLYEAEINFYNVQASSLAEKTVVWGN